MPACDNILPVTGRFSTAHFIIIGKRLLQYVFNTVRMDSVAVLPMPTWDNINLWVQCVCFISFPFSLLPSVTSQARNVHNLVLPKTKISVAVKSLDIYFFFCIPFAMLKGQVGCLAHGRDSTNQTASPTGPLAVARFNITAPQRWGTTEGHAQKFGCQCRTGTPSVQEILVLQRWAESRQ